MIEWIPEPSGLGLFSESTAAECLASVANKDACYAAVIAMGASGWNLILAPVFQDICLQEACGKGIILTPHEMQKVGAIVGTCMQKCVDDANTLSDPIARKAALAACPTTCNLVTVMESVQQTPPPPPPKKSNAVWWVLGGLAVLVGGYFLVKGAGSVGAVLGNPIPKKTLEELEEEAKNRIWEEGEGVGFEGGEPSEQDWQMVYETMGRLVESDEMTEEERAILREALRQRENPALRQELLLLPPSRRRKLYWEGYTAGYQDYVTGASPISVEEQAKHPKQYGVGYWMGYRAFWGDPATAY